jgi:hypothetical protein
LIFCEFSTNFLQFSLFPLDRVKAGNPGYLVAINPTANDVKANFTSSVVGQELSVSMTSGGDNTQQHTKVIASQIDLPKHSVGIFTFVPKA